MQTDLPFHFTDLSPVITSVIRRIVVEPNTSVADCSVTLEQTEGAAYFLLDFRQHQVAWSSVAQEVDALRTLCSRYNLLLAFPFADADWTAALPFLQPRGIEVEGGDELAMGMRDYETLNEWLDLITSYLYVGCKLFARSCLTSS